MDERAERPETIESVDFYIPIIKKSDEEKTVTGIALQPDDVDAQGESVSADVIRKAAHKFVEGYNIVTRLGLQHNDFKKRFSLLESYLAPIDMKLEKENIKKGAWIITVRVKDDDVWKKIKNGEIKGFSIGGKAKVVEVT